MPKGSRARAIAGYVIKALLGVALLAFILSRLNRHELLGLLSHERVGYFLLGTALYVSGQAIASYRWELLARMLGVTSRYIDLLLFFFIGSFTNLFVPGLVGGDAARAVYLGRRTRQMGKSVASVLADRLVGLLALVWVSVICVATLGYGVFPREVTLPTFVIGAISLVAFLAMPLVTLLSRLVPGRVRATIELLTPYLRGRIALLPPLALSFVLHVSQVVAQYVLGIGLGLSVPFRLFLLCVPIGNLFAALPITLNGLGVREGVYIVLFGMLGVGKADATALGLLWFASTTLAGLLESAAFVVAPSPIAPADSRGTATDDAKSSDRRGKLAL